MAHERIITAIEDVRRRAKWLSVVYGVGLVLAGVVGLLVTLVALDWLLNLPAWPRLMLVLASVGAIGWGLWKFVIRPGRSALPLSDVAGRRERAFPEFDDRLRSTLDFVKAGYVPGSDMMKQRTVDQAAELAGKVDLRSAIVARPAVRSMFGGVGAVVILLLLGTLVLDARTLQIITSRLLTPFSAMPWPKRVQIDMVGDLPQRVPVGHRIDVRMTLSRGDTPSMKPIVYYQVDDGPVQREFMTRNDDGTFSASLDARLESGVSQGRLRVWMTAGDDRVDAAPIVVVPRLAIASAQADVQKPEYARPAGATVAAQSYNLLTVPAIAVEGSTLSLRFDFNKPLADADDAVQLEPLDDASRALVSATVQRAERTGVFVWNVRLPQSQQQTLRFKVRARDIDGFVNDALEEFAVRIDRDQLPSVVIEQPRRNEERTAASRVPLRVVADDDFGFRHVTLNVRRINRAEQTWQIPLFDGTSPAAGVTWTRIEGSGDRARFRAAYTWQLGELEAADLQPGDVLEYHVIAQDNYELDGQQHDPVASDKLRITIISQADLIDRVADDLRVVRNQISDVRRTQNRTREDTAGLQDDVREKPELDEADRAAAERLAQQQSSTASSTRQLSQRVEQIRERLDENNSPADDLKNLARDVSEQLNRAAEGPMKQAANEINRTTQQPEQSPQDREQTLDRAQEQQRQADQQLSQALERMASIGSLASAIEQFNEIANQQRETSEQTREAGRNAMGKRPDQLTPEERKAIEDAARRQDELAERTEQAIEKLEEMAEQMQQSDPAAAEAMRNAARMARQQQVTQNQRRSSQQSRQNQQQSAQASQRQVELGLEMILNELREAERRRLRELQRELADLQKQVQTLLRRQAGHNLDNLMLQGPERLAKLSEIERKVLDALSERAGVENVPMPQLQGLTAAQQQTERNARDIARSAERVEGAGDVAARISRAASRMERAIFPLRERKLEDAYTPPQVEALAELMQAKEQVDKLKQQTDEQIAQEQQEAIRQKFIRIRDGQVKQVNTDPAAIEKNRRDGELNRADRIRASQLAEVQKKLAEEIRAIDADLAALGSVVYVWANKDIARSMDEVQTDLADARTGERTQSEQTRIVEQLNAMIANLAQREPDDEFEQPSDGGGGGGGGPQPPRLPGEAELRLLKSLQEAVNGSTKRIDAVARDQRDREALVGLGARQGELRDLLGELLDRASQGEIKLPPEPANEDQLPEEADPDQLADQELQDDLLGGDPDKEEIEKDITRVGTRMARSKQRLADNQDPGRVTQIIQEKILDDIDELIQMARQQQQRRRQQQQQQQQQQQGQQAQQQQQQAQNQGQNQQGQQQSGQDAADQSQAPGAGSNQADASRPLTESDAEWGTISPRLRDAVLESKNEDVVGEYRRMIEQYYKAVATEATKR